jgi:hypothetical protein
LPETPPVENPEATGKDSGAKRRIIQTIKEANREREEIIEEQNNFQKKMGLYEQEIYLQKGETPIKAMDLFFETW